MNHNNLPVAIIGAGPVGLAAAAHLVRRGETPLIFEAGSEAGSAVLEWGHVRVFSPWRYNIDHAARALLEDTGWHAPDSEYHPTGGCAERRNPIEETIPLMQQETKLNTPLFPSLIPSNQKRGLASGFNRLTCCQLWRWIPPFRRLQSE